MKSSWREQAERLSKDVAWLKIDNDRLRKRMQKVVNILESSLEIHLCPSCRHITRSKQMLKQHLSRKHHK